MSQTTDRVKSVLDEQLSATIYNMAQVLRGLLWPLVLEAEHDGSFGGHLGIDIDDAVSMVIRTSTFDKPERGSYPSWDKDRVRQQLDNLKAALAAKGIGKGD